MYDLMQHARATRSVSVAHAEAFQIMRYTSVDGLSSKWFWNSRDGVTPFGTTIDGVEYRHAFGGSYQPNYSAIIPAEAEYVWVSHTPATWRAIMLARWDRFAVDDDFDIRKTHPDREAWADKVPFEYGQPHQLTRAEFLAGTPEWMGQLAAKDGERD